MSIVRYFRLFLLVLILGTAVPVCAAQDQCELSIVVTGSGYLKEQGHCWLSVHLPETAEYPVTAGQVELSPGDSFSIGLWPAQKKDEKADVIFPGGAYINRELYLRYEGEAYTNGCVTYTTEQKLSDLMMVVGMYAGHSHYYSDWDNLEHNCTTVAVKAWNKVCSFWERVPSITLYDAPVELKNWLLAMKEGHVRYGAYSTPILDNDKMVYYMAQDGELFGYGNSVKVDVASRLLIPKGESSQIEMWWSWDDIQKSISKYAKFKTMDASVATVSSEGRVTGHKAGKTTIQITLWNTFEYECEVEIIDSAIELKSEELTLKVGESKRIEAVVSGVEAEPVWNSMSGSIAQVDQEGFVYGMEEGETTIYANVPGAYASCKVTVEKEESEVQDIYYRYIRDNLLPQNGYSNLNWETLFVSSNVYNAMEILEWDHRTGLISADIVDMDQDGIEDLLVYYIGDYNPPGYVKGDWEDTTGTLMAELYTLDENQQVIYKDTLRLLTCKGVPQQYAGIGIARIENSAYLYVEMESTAVFADGENISYRLYEYDGETLNGVWRIEKSEGGSSSIAHSLYECSHGEEAQTVLDGDGDYRYFHPDEEIKFPENTPVETSFGWAFDKVQFTGASSTIGSLGIRSYLYNNCPVYVGEGLLVEPSMQLVNYVERLDSGKNIISTLTDSTALQEHIAALDS